jgi:hypothetical protein
VVRPERGDGAGIGPRESRSAPGTLLESAGVLKARVPEVKPFIIITATSFMLAVALTVVAEKRNARARARDLAMWATLLALYCVCVGLVSVVMAHFFAVGQWTALAISFPLGLPALYVVARMSEA